VHNQIIIQNVTHSIFFKNINYEILTHVTDSTAQVRRPCEHSSLRTIRIQQLKMATGTKKNAVETILMK
jgi:hypothetical protein